jgi:hypothetical protein
MHKYNNFAEILMIFKDIKPFKLIHKNYNFLKKGLHFKFLQTIIRAETKK